MSVVVGTHKPVRATTAPRVNGRAVVLITLAALGLYVAARNLPTGTNLSHMDFRAGQGGAEFCDPANPQFMPVATVRSPVEIILSTEATPTMGRVTHATARLATASGKPVRPEDLRVVHTQRLHLLIVDAGLSDYQHVHPQPGQVAGDWTFSFTPRRAGNYRVYADFTPAATGRGLYAGADLIISPGSAPQAPMPAPASGALYQENGYIFSLRPATAPRAGQQLQLTFEIRRGDADPVALEPVMDAYAHLVAFDVARTGFAHLHPNEADLSQAPDVRRPRLTFKVTMPSAGRYVIWAQVKIKGRDVFAPFWMDVGA